MATSRHKDMTGMRFGKLTVIEYVGNDKYKNALWKCKCDCGNETIASRKCLADGSTKSCGCLHKHDLKGKRFGRLVVLEEVGINNRRRAVWRCKCDCGNIVNVNASLLVLGHTRSCGCLMRETSRKTLTTHGKTKTRLHTIWMGMRARCNNPNHDAYKNYGGRGIRVCEEWKDFSTFEKWALENGYDENAKRGKCTIDRINNDGNYEPSNCRWVDMKTQANNKRPRKKGCKRGPYKKRTAS